MIKVTSFSLGSNSDTTYFVSRIIENLWYRGLHFCLYFCIFLGVWERRGVGGEVGLLLCL
jgi:hypothetical protein